MVCTLCLVPDSLFETGHNIWRMVHCYCLRSAVLCSDVYCKLPKDQKETLGVHMSNRFLLPLCSNGEEFFMLMFCQLQ